MTNGLVKELLGALTIFQQRLKERDPINAKHKLRFLLGMKQVNSHSFWGKCSMASFHISALFEGVGGSASGEGENSSSRPRL